MALVKRWDEVPVVGSQPQNRGLRVATSWRKELTLKQDESWIAIRAIGHQERSHLSDHSTYVLADALQWLTELPPCSIHACVTDPPFSLLEYSTSNHVKLRSGKGGVWRIPPSFDGASRQPLPRFTVLSNVEINELHAFFLSVATELTRVLVPGGHVFLASNPLLSSVTFNAFQSAGFEKRGEIIRQVQTLRGGDRPKGAEDEFPEISMMPRSCWEPWGIFRKPLEGTAADNLKRWGTGGLRRPSKGEPFKDLITCSPTRGLEKRIAPHPSLKPQRFLRQIVRAALPLGIGIVYDAFAGSSSTLAAAEALGYLSIGTDRDEQYYKMACSAFRGLADLPLPKRHDPTRGLPSL
jgi:site-specific DNA-methyltransferase (adenine-specific)